MLFRFGFLKSIPTPAPTHFYVPARTRAVLLANLTINKGDRAEAAEPRGRGREKKKHLRKGESKGDRFLAQAREAPVIPNDIRDLSGS